MQRWLLAKASPSHRQKISVPGGSTSRQKLSWAHCLTQGNCSSTAAPHLLRLSYFGQHVSKEMLTLICLSQTTEKPTAAERRRGSGLEFPLPPLPSGTSK